MKKSLFFGMAAMLMAGITSCSNDDLLEGGGSQPLDSDQSFFVNINIASASEMTRAGGQEGPYTGEGWNPEEEPNFDKGEKFGNVDENAVKTIFLIFYDENGKRVYTTQVRKDNDNTAKPGTNASENSLYQGIVQVDVKHGSLKPTHVMCFINPITSQSFEMNPDFETLDALEKTTRPQIIDDNGYFAMSKSVYFGIDRAKKDEQGNTIVQENSPENYEKIIATPIPDGSFFDTYDEAKKAIDAYEKKTEGAPETDPVLDIYVERYAAKVNLQFAKLDDGREGYYVKDMEGNDIVFGTTDEGKQIKLEFIPEYWAVNAYESDTYICKSFMNEAGSDNLTYEQMNEALGGSGTASMPWFWNSTEHHRSYWAQTPGYYKKSYPRVGDDLLDFDAGHSVIGNDSYALGYYSYDKLVELSEESLKNPITRKVRSFAQESKEKRNDGSTWPIYVRENTVSGQALQDAAKSDLMSAKAAIGSIILVGHYAYEDQDLDDTFWITGNATNGYTFFKDNKAVIDYLMNTSVHFAVNASGTKEVFDNALEGFGFTEDGESVREYFIMQHPTYDTRSQAGQDGLVLDSRFETVQLDKEKFLDEDVTLYAQLNGKWEKVTEDNIDAINLQMLYQSGTAQGYKGGKAYFSIPIQHLGYYRKGNNNYKNGLTANDKKFDWTEVRSGDFGLVRNHVYTIEVQDIVGLGNGIPDPSVPIVPPTDPEEYFIGARIIVLNWAIVPTQKVTL